MVGVLNADKRARGVARLLMQGNPLFSTKDATASSTLQFPISSSSGKLSQLHLFVTGDAENMEDLTHDAAAMNGEPNDPKAPAVQRY